jgi:hypothetical protein
MGLRVAVFRYEDTVGSTARNRPRNVKRIKEQKHVYIGNYRIPYVAGDDLVQLQNGTVGTQTL